MMSATEQAVLTAAQGAVQEAQRRVDDLLKAQQMLDTALPEAQSVLRAAHAALRRAKAARGFGESRKAEIALLQQRIDDVQQSEDQSHVH